MSSSTPNLRFLIDENVKKKLSDFLKNQDFDVKLAPKSIPDLKLAAISKKEDRILVTNDKDFESYTKDQVFSLVILNVPQKDTKSLIESFAKLLKECKVYEENLIILQPNSWKSFNLFIKVKI